MVYLKNKFEIEKLYCAGQIVKETLYLIEDSIKPGITTMELDKIAEEYILSKPWSAELFDIHALPKPDHTIYIQCEKTSSKKKF